MSEHYVAVSFTRLLWTLLYVVAHMNFTILLYLIFYLHDL